MCSSDCMSPKLTAPSETPADSERVLSGDLMECLSSGFPPSQTQLPFPPSSALPIRQTTRQMEGGFCFLPSSWFFLICYCNLFFTSFFFCKKQSLWMPLAHPLHRLPMWRWRWCPVEKWSVFAVGQKVPRCHRKSGNEFMTCWWNSAVE